MTKTANQVCYKFIMADGSARYVHGKGRQSACMKLTGMRYAAAVAAGQIKSAEKMAAA